MVLGGCYGRKAFLYCDGFIFGTVYSITYEHNVDLQPAIDSVLHSVDNALSMFNEQSVITAVNSGGHQIPHSIEGDMFCEVFELASQVSADTDGAFDITVAPLVNAWGFGFKEGTQPDSAAVDSILQFVGFDKVSYWADLGERGINRMDSRTMLDCSAVAKGYGVDRVAHLLRQEGVENFMVEIGGEVVTRGHNPQGQLWHIGVTKPTDDPLAEGSELQTVLAVSNQAMATSGNYRNFYYKDGRKYAHTIDPHTGYPVQHELLSATVLAPTCAMADAYATSFMVMGMDKARQKLELHKDLMAYFIYVRADGSLQTWFSPGMTDMLTDN